MSNNTEAQIREVHAKWHEMISTQNLEGLMSLYTEDAVLESSAVLVIEKDPSGTLRGKQALRTHFATFFAMMKQEKDGAEWYRSTEYFSDGKTVSWEYPSKGPAGEQLDVVESVDMVDGKIVYQRVYWGFVGFKLLMGFAGLKV